MNGSSLIEDVTWRANHGKGGRHHSATRQGLYFVTGNSEWERVSKSSVARCGVGLAGGTSVLHHSAPQDPELHCHALDVFHSRMESLAQSSGKAITFDKKRHSAPVWTCSTRDPGVPHR